MRPFIHLFILLILPTFTLAQGDNIFNCETSDSFFEIKYSNDNINDIVLNEWKNYRKEGKPLFTVNSKTGDLKLLSSEQECAQGLISFFKETVKK